MKRLITSLMLLASILTAHADETKMVPLVGNVLNRQTTSLNGEWRYIVDVQESGYYDLHISGSRACPRPSQFSHQCGHLVIGH